MQLDLVQVGSIIKFDAQDTLSKLTSVKNVLQQTNFCIDSLDTDDTYESDYNQEVLGQFVGEISQFVGDAHTSEQSVVVGSDVFAVKVAGDPDNYEEASVAVADFNSDKMSFVVKTVDGVYTPIFRANGVDRTLWDDFQRIDFSSLNIGSTSIAGLVDTLKSNSQCQGLLSDVADVLTADASIDTVYNKWFSLNDKTLDFSQMLQELTPYTGSKESIVQFLGQVYSQAADTTYDQQTHKIRFVDVDNYSVKLAWGTIIPAIGNAVSTAVATIGLVIGGVAGPILSIAGFAFNSLYTVVKGAENPLSKYNSKLLAVWNLPIFQQVITNDRDSYWTQLYNLRAASCDNGIYTIRYWYDNPDQCFEVFLRPCLSPRDINSFGDYNQLFLGVAATDQVKQAQGSYHDPEGDCFGPGVCITEAGQALTTAANLYACLRSCDMIDSVNWNAYPDTSWSDLWDIVDSGSASDKINACIALCQKSWHICWYVPEQVACPTTAQDLVLKTYMTWYKLINKLMPIIRDAAKSTYRGPSMYIPGIGYPYSLNDVITSGNLNKYANGGFIVRINADNPNFYGISTPRISSEGILGMIALTTAAIIGVSVVSSVIIRKIKYAVRKMQMKSFNDCVNQRQDYLNAVNGLDSDGKTPKAYTKAEIDALYKRSYKTTRKYNRFAVLWGGDSFNLVNGWSDGPASSAAKAVSNNFNPIFDSLQQLNPVGPAVTESFSLSDIYHTIK